MISRAASVIFASAALGGAAEAQLLSVDVQGSCRVVRIAPNGARNVTPPRRAAQAGEVAVTVRKGGSVGTARMAGSGRSSSTTIIGGVTVTLTRDERGCQAVIDERPQQGSF